MLESVARSACQADFTFTTNGGPVDELLVTAFSGTEAISELFRFRVELCSDDADIDFNAIVGQPCALEIAGSSGSRFVNGIVRCFERTGCGSRVTHYAAEIVPVHWLLTKRVKSRIFQASNCPDTSVPGIIQKVFEDAGIPADRFRFALGRDYEPREFVVQYRESDMDFISRLMEHEGIFYFFEHDDVRHTMVIGDSPVAHTETPNEAEYPFRDPNGLVAEKEHVFELRDSQQIRIGAVNLDDFDFKRPASQLRAGVKSDQHTALELTDYPGEYQDESVGERYAQVRLEEGQAARRLMQMCVTARGLLPGFKFSVTEHPTDELNREYLATEITHRARQPQSAREEALVEGGITYEADVQAMPADVPFRPERTTPRPTVLGSQTALVVGPPGEEIWPDEYGRIKVQFHWDQEGQYDENSSCWIRVSQGWAGGNYGMFFLPRVGQEVIVDFLEGNPDRPIITGSVHNNDNMPPYKLPDEKTISTIKTRSSTGGGGTNEIRFEDRKDSEQLLVYAQKDFHVRVNNDRIENVDHDHHLTVKENKYELVKQSKHAEVKLDLKQKVGGGSYLEVAGDVGEEFKGNHSEHASKYYLSADGNAVIESASGITLKVGGNFITINASGIYVMGTVVHLNSEGSALNGLAVATQSPEEPLEADTVDPGADVTYSADPYSYEALEGATGESTSDEADDENESSWIEIELVDEAGQPWPNEPYEIVEPDGTMKKGSLDENGQAHVAVSDPGECQISFPKLDRRAWERT